MAFFFTESQVVEAAIRAYREHAEADSQLLALERQSGPVPLSSWTDPQTELDQLGEAFKGVLSGVRPVRPVLSLVSR